MGCKDTDTKGKEPTLIPSLAFPSGASNFLPSGASVSLYLINKRDWLVGDQLFSEQFTNNRCTGSPWVSRESDALGGRLRRRHFQVHIVPETMYYLLKLSSAFSLFSGQPWSRAPPKMDATSS